MDPVLRARVGLPETARLRMTFLRGVLRGLDSISKSVSGRPFFGLRESEALMSEIAGLHGPDLVAALLCSRGDTDLVVDGRDNVPASGPVIITATHPTGMFDYVAHAGALLDLRPDLKVVATEEARHFLDDNTIVPVKVDKQYRSTTSRATLNAMADHLSKGGALLVFGSGRVSHAPNGKLIEPVWRGGPTRVSEMCQAPLVPAALNARNTNYYYRLRGLAQRLSGDEHTGAMFGSVRHLTEFMEKLGGRYEVVYGAPMPPGTDAARLQKRAEGLIPELYASH